jgi:hypothetical protein
LARAREAVDSFCSLFVRVGAGEAGVFSVREVSQEASLAQDRRAALGARVAGISQRRPSQSATARPPAGAIQAYPLGFSALKRTELL